MTCSNISAAPKPRIQTGNRNTGACGIMDKFSVAYVDAYMINDAGLTHAEHDEIADRQLGFARNPCAKSGLGFGTPRDAHSVLLKYELRKGGAIKYESGSIPHTESVSHFTDIRLGYAYCSVPVSRIDLLGRSAGCR